jgi:peptidoglycan/LPS O-acetylase OafA/YrhL
MTDPTRAQRAHIPALDGLRGIAILLVMAQHFIPLEASPAGEQMVRLVAAAGWAGVDLFFVLSGFLITGILFDARRSTNPWLPFYARRALRILPAFVVVMLGLVLLGVGARTFDPEGFGALLSNQGWQWAFLTNVRIAIDGSWRLFPYTGHLWSLGVEEQFYVVWPAIVLLLTPRKVALVAIAAVPAALLFRAALIGAGLPPIGALVLAPAKMDELALGGLLALALRDQAMRTRVRRLVDVTRGGVLPLAAFMVAAVVATSVVVTSEASNTVAWSYVLGQSAVAICAAVAVASLVSPRVGDPVVQLCERPWLRSVGTYSYGLYLIHYPLEKLAHQLDKGPGFFRSVIPSHLIADIVFAVVLGAISVALAALLWHGVEKPVMRLRSRFPYGGAVADHDDPALGKAQIAAT